MYYYPTCAEFFIKSLTKPTPKEIEKWAKNKGYELTYSSNKGDYEITRIQIINWLPNSYK